MEVTQLMMNKEPCGERLGSLGEVDESDRSSHSNTSRSDLTRLRIIEKQSNATFQVPISPRTHQIRKSSNPDSSILHNPAQMRCPYCHSSISGSPTIPRAYSQFTGLRAVSPIIQPRERSYISKNLGTAYWEKRLSSDHEPPQKRQEYITEQPRSQNKSNCDHSISKLHNLLYSPTQDEIHTQTHKAGQRYAPDASFTSFKSDGRSMNRLASGKLSEFDHQENYQFLNEIGRLLIKSNTRDFGLETTGNKSETDREIEQQLSGIPNPRPSHMNLSPLISPKTLEALHQKPKIQPELKRHTHHGDSLNFDITPSVSARYDANLGHSSRRDIPQSSDKRPSSNSSKKPALKIKVPGAYDDLYSPETPYHSFRRDSKLMDDRGKRSSISGLKEACLARGLTSLATRTTKSAIRNYDLVQTTRKKVKFSLESAYPNHVVSLLCRSPASRARNATPLGSRTIHTKPCVPKSPVTAKTRTYGTTPSRLLNNGRLLNKVQPSPISQTRTGFFLSRPSLADKSKLSSTTKTAQPQTQTCRSSRLKGLIRSLAALKALAGPSISQNKPYLTPRKLID